MDSSGLDSIHLSDWDFKNITGDYYEEECLNLDHAISNTFLFKR